MTRWNGSRWISKECGAASGGGGGGAPSGFSVNLIKLTPSPLELGAVLPPSTQFNVVDTNPAGPLITRTIQDDQGNGAVVILGEANPVPNAGMGFAYSKTVIGDTVDFTYSADDGGGVKQDTEQYVWLPRVYLGVEPIPGAINEAFVEALVESELRSNKGISRAVLWTAAEYIWAAFPQAFNPTQSTDFLVTIGGSGFPGGFVLAASGVSVTPNTTNGVPILYDVWRSTGSGSGLNVNVAVAP